MPSRTTILAATAIASLAFSTTAAIAKGGRTGGPSVSMGVSKGTSTGMSTGLSKGMSTGMSAGMHAAPIGGMHHHHHRHFFFVGGVYTPYYTDYDYGDDESCPLVRRRVQTDHGLRWRTVRVCAY